MKRVAALPRDDVDDPAQRAAELGLVAAGLDLDFVDEFEGHVLAAGAGQDVADVRAVDVEHVFQAGRAVDRDAGEELLIVDARHGAEEGVEVAAVRQDLESLPGQGHPLDRRLDVDERRLADDRHFLLDGAQGHGGVKLQGLLDGENDPGPNDGLESLESEGNLVIAGGEAEEAIDADGVGQSGRLADEPGTGGLDGDARQGIALFIGDGAEHLAVGI